MAKSKATFLKSAAKTLKKGAEVIAGKNDDDKIPSPNNDFIKSSSTEEFDVEMTKEYKYSKTQDSLYQAQIDSIQNDSTLTEEEKREKLKQLLNEKIEQDERSEDRASTEREKKRKDNGRLATKQLLGTGLFVASLITLKKMFK